MDFDFTDDQNSLRDAVARWVDKGFDFPRRHALAKAGGFSRAVYAELAELGLTGLAVPEAHGGMGFGAVEAMVVMEELGRGLVNAPYAAGALVTPALLSAAPAELQAAWLPRIAGADAPAMLITSVGLEALELAQDVGIAAVCAEGVGLMDKLVAITVEYMNTRKQFGVTLATFQALRHRIADVKMQLELGRSISYFASLKLGENAAQRRRALSQAKVQMGQSMRFVGQQCIQLHGGIGVTDEYAGSHYFKRLTMLEMTWGDTLHHLGEVSARMQDTAGVFA